MIAAKYIFPEVLQCTTPHIFLPGTARSGK